MSMNEALGRPFDCNGLALKVSRLEKFSGRRIGMTHDLQSANRRRQAKAYCFCDMGFAHGRGSVEICNRAGDAEHPVVAPGRQTHSFGNAGDEGLAFAIRCGELLQR